MQNKFLLFLISLLFITSVGAVSVFAQNQNDKYDNKTTSRLKSMQQYRETLQKNYSDINKFEISNEIINNENVKRSLSVTLKLLDEGINMGFDCTTKLESDQKPECILAVKKAYNKAQIGYRLVKYYAIMAGKPTICVKADLGESPHLKAHGVTKLSERDARLAASGTPNLKETGQSANNRLFLCGGNENTAGDVQIKWRVQDRNGKFITITPADKEKLSLGTDITNLANKNHVEKALKELGF